MKTAMQHSGGCSGHLGRDRQLAFSKEAVLALSAHLLSSSTISRLRTFWAHSGPESSTVLFSNHPEWQWDCACLLGSKRMSWRSIPRTPKACWKQLTARFLCISSPLPPLQPQGWGPWSFYPGITWTTHNGHSLVVHRCRTAFSVAPGLPSCSGLVEKLGRGSSFQVVRVCMCL